MFAWGQDFLRGVKQGSVLSPLLFLLVIDSLLVDLESSGTGALINGLYLGSLGHADDLRSITPNIALLEQQASIVTKFTKDNGLQLNTDKLELQEFSLTKPTPQNICVDGTLISSVSNTTCLGVIWSLYNLSLIESINGNNYSQGKACLFSPPS